MVINKIIRPATGADVSLNLFISINSPLVSLREIPPEYISGQVNFRNLEPDVITDETVYL